MATFTIVMAVNFLPAMSENEQSVLRFSTFPRLWYDRNRSPSVKSAEW
jgi:hypothetical protein